MKELNGLLRVVQVLLLLGVWLSGLGSTDLIAHSRGLPNFDLELPSADRIVPVSNSRELQKALDSAEGGERIVLEDGPYGGAFEIVSSGSPSRPIVIVSEHLLSAGFPGSLRVQGDGVLLLGVRFSQSKLLLEGADIRVSRCLFDGVDRRSASQVEARGSGTVIERCEFRNSSGSSILGNAAEGMQGMTVRRCYFRNLKTDGEGAGAFVQMGDTFVDGSKKTSCIVEYNLFEHLEGEAVSVVTDQNVVRFNTLVDSWDAGFTNRSGIGNRFLANWVERSGGFKVGGDKGAFIGNVVLESQYGFRILAGTEQSGEGGVTLVGRACANSRFISNRSDVTTVGASLGSEGTLVPVRNAHFEGHHGLIDLQCEEGTVEQGETSKVVPQAFRLRKEEVGPVSVSEEVTVHSH